MSIPKTLKGWGKSLLFRRLKYLPIAIILALGVVVQHKTVFVDKNWDRKTVELFVVFQDFLHGFVSIHFTK